MAIHQPANIHDKIATFHGPVLADPHHRYRSWEHCYRFFRSQTREDIAAQPDSAALHLWFYLASWGMYRGSSFLLQRAYTVHLDAVNRLVSPQFSALWDTDVGSKADDVQLAPTILGLVEAIREAYAPFNVPTDTLVTKVILGTLGCLPACDRFFVEGFKRSGFRYAYVNERFVTRIIGFCRNHLPELRAEQAMIETSGRVIYPLMKLADMYFWQVGYEVSEMGEE